MQTGAVGGINGPFQNLCPVAGHYHLGNAHPDIGRRRIGWRLECRHAVGRPEVGPHPAAPFLHRPGRLLHTRLECAGVRLGGHVEHVAVDIHFPAVIQAAQSTFFVASQHQRGTPVRTQFIQYAHLAVAIAKHHQIMTEHPCLHRRAIGLGYFLAQADGYPVPAHQLPHWRLALDAAQQIVFFGAQHAVLLQRS